MLRFQCVPNDQYVVNYAQLQSAHSPINEGFRRLGGQNLIGPTQRNRFPTLPIGAMAFGSSMIRLAVHVRIEDNTLEWTHDAFAASAIGE
jgi:hypothetical protein